MVVLVRVDDRLLHGQITCAWVPHTGADRLVVVSDEAAGDNLARDLICSCPQEGLTVVVKKVSEAAGFLAGEKKRRDGAIVVFGSLRDAMRAYEGGFKFTALNLGNIHHGPDGRTLTPSVIVNSEDEDIIERLISLGVSVEIRDVPAGRRVDYEAEAGEGDSGGAGAEAGRG